jgi:hypothetical protein
VPLWCCLAILVVDKSLISCQRVALWVVRWCGYIFSSRGSGTALTKLFFCYSCVVFLQEFSSSFSPQVSRFLPHLIPLLQTSRQSRPVASRSSSLALATTSNLSAGGWRLHPVGLCSGVRRAGGRESAGRGAPENGEFSSSAAQDAAVKCPWSGGDG